MLNRDEARPTRVVIADDHELVRRGLRLILDGEPDMTVVAEASNGDEARAAAIEHDPDVLLLDLRMPGRPPARVCADVLEHCPWTRVIVLSTFDDDADVYAMMEAGASGYLLKSVAPEALVRSIRGVVEGSIVMNPEIGRRLMHLRTAPGAADSVDALSEREREVLECMARGLKNRDIAREMWISESTVKTHVGNVIRKLGQRDRTQAVLYAIKAGIVSMASD